MFRRFLCSLRLLCGLPVSPADLLPAGSGSEVDHTKVPPLPLVFGGLVPLAPPVRVFGQERLRVCVFAAGEDKRCDDCGGRLHWLTVELKSALDEQWHHVVSLSESRLPILQSVLAEVGAYLDSRHEALRPDAARVCVAA